MHRRSWNRILRYNSSYGVVLAKQARCIGKGKVFPGFCFSKMYLLFMSLTKIPPDRGVELKGTESLISKIYTPAETGKHPPTKEEKRRRGHLACLKYLRHMF